MRLWLWSSVLGPILVMPLVLFGVWRWQRRHRQQQAWLAQRRAT